MKTHRTRGVTAVADHYEAIHGAFRWQVPLLFNIAEACCGRWARRAGASTAIVEEREDGARREISYAELQHRADALSRALRARGVAHGDRIAIVMPQRIETAVAHVAIHQLGAVSMPLSMLFGPDAIEYRLRDSGARVAIADESGIANLNAARAACPALDTVIAVGDAQGRGDVDWDDALGAQAGAGFVPAVTSADDAAMLIYTSGTTGPPKGALIPHRALIGNLSGFVCSQNGYPLVIKPPSPGKGGVGTGPRPSAGLQNAQSVFWSPADWAWTGGLMDALLPTLYFGRTIVAYRGRFDAERALDLMARHGVTHTFLFPTALKAMMKAVPAPRARFELRLAAIMSAGEAVGDAVFAWGREQLGVTINEMFGQTEINYVVGNGSVAATDGSLIGWAARAGSMGRPYPGHRIAVLDDAGHECPRGAPGDVAVHRRDIHGHPDPVFFLGYWNNDEATRRKYTGDPANSWCRTGDTAVMDEHGYLWYHGRGDDMFKAAGYRIGPSEVENCLVKHPAVANAAVVPKPDAERGAVVKAYVVLAPGFVAGDVLVKQLQQHVRGKLAPYEYPKEIEFIDALPMTTTGKVQRNVLRRREQERSRTSAAGAT